MREQGLNLYQEIKKSEEIRDILKRAIALEEQKKDDEFLPRLGWEWDDLDLPANPVRLHQMYLKGLLKKIYKSRSHTGYLIVDKEAIKGVLLLLEEEESEREQNLIEISADLFDIIASYDDLKEQLMENIKAERQVHTLLVGPYSTGKSLFLEQLRQLPSCSFITMGTSTKAGIRDLLMEECPHFLLIDELDKLSSHDDLAALYTYMEIGIVVSTKHDEHRVTGTSGKVFACANRIDRLPKELLSRFDIYFLPEYSDEEFLNVSKRVLTEREGVQIDLADYISVFVLRDLHEKDVRECVRIARVAKCKEDVDRRIEIKKRYKKYKEKEDF